MSIWVVKPEEKKLDLVYVSPGGQSYPFWVRIKKFLTVGEQRRVMTAGWRGMSTGKKDEDGNSAQEISIDWKTQTFARTETYLIAWSIEGDDTKPLPITRETIESLNPEVYAVIDAAITAHVKETEDEKKVTDGTPSPSVTSV
jgi:hypothetical protein